MITDASILNKVEDYSEILIAHDLNHSVSGYYLQVGKITKTQGWLLHLSVIISQVESIFQTIIPVLKKHNIPFKIPIDREACINLLQGYFGEAQIGKIITIYPETDYDALLWAKRLAVLTASYKGPYVPTDIHLGGAVYTRYGGFNPIRIVDSFGKEEKFIYNHNREVIKDEYSIPFSLPEGIAWPFTELKSPLPHREPSILNHLYKPLEKLKTDVRGNVYKGLYLKGVFRVTKCVIKQGKKNMSSEDNGRDMSDRLKWQQELYHQLSDTVPLPRVIDLFQQSGDTYLVIEYVNGSSLYDQRMKMISDLSWFDIPQKVSLQLIDYLIEIVDIIDRLHKKGYVHRDIAPGNFLIDNKKRIILIDIELAYCYSEKKPPIPFSYGTPGFMSPEQQMMLAPTVKEDIYGLGALMISVFTGFSPTKFNIFSLESIYKSLSFFIGSSEIASLIANCLSLESNYRPELHQIKGSLAKYRKELENLANPKKIKEFTTSVNEQELIAIIGEALTGLSRPPIVMLSDMWYSKTGKNEHFKTIQQKEYSRYIGLYEGVGGIIYLLSRAKQLNYDITPCMNGYLRGWEFIEEQVFSFPQGIKASLYKGCYGVALSLKEAMKSGLKENSDLNKERVKKCLEISTSSLDIANGLAGKGVAILQCIDLLDNETFKKLLNNCIDGLLSSQGRDGSWSFSYLQENKIKKEDISFGYGITGITWFLLQVNFLYPDVKLEEAAIRSLDWLLKRTNNLESLFNSELFHKKILVGPERGDERKGVILAFIKAYQTLGIPKYKQITEQALYRYPANIIKNDLSQDSGLAGLGEIYLEAFKVFKKEDWQKRAGWITNIYIHLMRRDMGESGYWMLEENNSPTADFMIGNSGIIHYLLRFLYPQQIGYRFFE